MTPDRAAHIGPYFEVQLRLARRMSELTGIPLSQSARDHTNLHRRFGLGDDREPVAPLWAQYVERLDQLANLADQLSWTQEIYRRAPEEPVLAGRTRFGCFACEAPSMEGMVRIHFSNRDTDEAGGPLAKAKVAARVAEITAMLRHIREVHPGATRIQGGSWLYHIEAYRRLFPADYVASRTPWTGRITLTGTSSWGQLIDSRERIRPDIRDALVTNLVTLDPAAPWRAFPFQVLSVTAPMESFYFHFGMKRLPGP